MSDNQTNENPNIYKIQMHRWRMAFFGLVILLAGIVIGASAALIGKWHFLKGPGQGPERTADRMVQGLRHELRLSPDQRRQIDPLIQKHMERLDQIRKEARPLIENELRQMNDEIAPLLDDYQRQMWMQMQKRLPIEQPPIPDIRQMPPRPQPPFGRPPRQPQEPMRPENVEPQPPPGPRPENQEPMPPQ
jgi:hypothetical protein